MDVFKFTLSSLYLRLAIFLLFYHVVACKTLIYILNGSDLFVRLAYTIIISTFFHYAKKDCKQLFK